AAEPARADKPAAKEERAPVAPRKAHEARPARQGEKDEAPHRHAKAKHGSHRMPVAGEDVEGAVPYFGAELHLSDAGHARRGAVKKKPRKQIEPARAAS